MVKANKSKDSVFVTYDINLDNIREQIKNLDIKPEAKKHIAAIIKEHGSIENAAKNAIEKK